MVLASGSMWGQGGGIFYHSSNASNTHITIGTILQDPGNRQPAASTYSTSEYEILGSLVDQVVANKSNVERTHYPGYPGTGMDLRNIDGFYQARSYRANRGYAPFGAYLVRTGDGTLYTLFRDGRSDSDDHIIEGVGNTVQGFKNHILQSTFGRSY